MAGDVAPRGEVERRVLGEAVAADLEMQVRPRRVARGADGADHLADCDGGAVDDERGGEVGVQAREAGAVVDHDVEPVAARGEQDVGDPGEGRPHRGPRRRGEVEAAVEVTLRAEPGRRFDGERRAAVPLADRGTVDRGDEAATARNAVAHRTGSGGGETGRAQDAGDRGGEHRADHVLRRVVWPWWTVARRIVRSSRWPRVSAFVSRWAATLSAPGTLSMRNSVASA